MKYRTVIKTISGGTIVIIAQGEPIEMTEEEFEDNLDVLKRIVNDANYMELNGVVIPGEFLKTRCFVHIVKED
jgi:hypothetical protein